MEINYLTVVLGNSVLFPNRILTNRNEFHQMDKHILYDRNDARNDGMEKKFFSTPNKSNICHKDRSLKGFWDKSTMKIYLG